MFGALRSWKRKRILERAAIPESLWREALESLPFLAIYTDAELSRLRELVVVFLSDKNIVAAAGFKVTPLMRVVIAIQAVVIVYRVLDNLNSEVLIVMQLVMFQYLQTWEIAERSCEILWSPHRYRWYPTLWRSRSSGSRSTPSRT
jgi:Mlc titration factor MtfA (ptsG expression regulator)